MKNKTPFIIIIAILLLIIAGLLIFIVTGNKKDSQPDNKQAMEPMQIETVSDAETDTEEASEEEKQDDKKQDDKKQDDKKESSEEKSDCYVTVSPGANWPEGDKFVYQYDIELHNNSSSDLKGWEIRLSGFTGGEIGDNWSGKFSIKDDILTITCVDYNESIAAKSTASIGCQIKFADKDSGLTDKTPELYVDGKLYSSGVSNDKEDSKDSDDSKDSKDKKESSESKDDAKSEKTEKKEKKAPEKGTPLENHGALSIKGTDIVDKNNEKYQLRGISTHGLAWFPDYVNKDSFKTFRDDWGANLIRLAMYTGENGGYCQDGDKDSLKKLVCNGVDYATELGMYVIIDWHILSDNNPKTNQDEAVKFFEEMSSKYASYDNVLYEICNEPNGGTSWSDIKEYAETVIPVIRKNDKDAIIIVGTPTWSQDADIAAEDPIEGESNIAYTVHFYAATHKENIMNKVRTAHDKGLCVFISEFSICDASGNGGIDYDSADEWFKLIDEYNLSYAGWNLSNKDETSSLIAPDCTKISGWSDSDLSETGKWLKEKIGE